MNPQKIAIMGAGAVGCYYGAMLALAGEAVCLIGRPALAEAVRADGLLLEKAGTMTRVAVEASTEPDAVAGADIVLFCVKSPDTEAAGAAIAPFLAEGATVLSLQNGVSNAGRLAAVLGRPVIPAVVYVAAQMSGAAHVTHRGRGELILGEHAASATVAARLCAAGIPTEVSATADSALWSKLVINCTLNAVSALTGQPYGPIIAMPGAEELMRGIVAECAAVASAAGVPLPADLLAQAMTIARTMPGQISSTAQDMQRGKTTEIDYLNGEIVRLAAAYGIPVPLNNALTLMVRLAETR
ncbi:ketopantoate reductase family protein [Phaeovulum sp. W22_SRMD_FR3]|uniref:ketopantoate reductase family protein n=1 Tax=Phaeovulum sp. W22_SRMD_FR3 TaxID=3240274 RepID=UPI003F9DBAE0